MKLYVVLIGLDYEAYDTFAGAYSTRELAEIRLRECKNYDSKRILEISINEAHDAF